MVTYNNYSDTGFTLTGFHMPQRPHFQLVLVTHDELSFYVNDSKDKATPQCKSERPWLIISDMLTAEWGRLQDGKEWATAIWSECDNWIRFFHAAKCKLFLKQEKTEMGTLLLKTCLNKLNMQLTCLKQTQMCSLLDILYSIILWVTKSMHQMLSQLETCPRTQRRTGLTKRIVHTCEMGHLAPKTYHRISIFLMIAWQCLVGLQAWK